MSSRWICSQIGGREHYAVPRAFLQASRLARLYTDYWASSRIRKLAQMTHSRALNSLATRYHTDLANSSIRSWNLRAISWEAESRFRSQKECGPYTNYLRIGRRFAVLVRDSLARNPQVGRDSILFVYDTGGLETLEWCRERGISSVVDQIDPNRIEVNLVREEEKRWHGWQAAAMEVPEAYFRRREREWALADRVVVNSEFSRRALLEQGVPKEKLRVIPLCYEAGSESARMRLQRPQGVSLRVIWLGQVILRKGIQYLFQAAKDLEEENIEFHIVGPLGISPEAVASAPGNVVFHGRATRDQVSQWYLDADVFVLPTLSDGFAITQIEAMAHGLPVVTTPCCGEVVTDGVDGFVVPARDPKALAMALQRYLSEPRLLREHGAAALEKSKQFTLRHLGDRLLALEAELTGS